MTELITGIMIGLSVGIWIGSYSNKILNVFKKESNIPQDKPISNIEDKLLPSFNPNEVSNEERRKIKDKYLGRKS